MIATDVVDKYLRTCFGNSEPGDTMHHLLVAEANPNARGPLGQVDPDELRVTIYAIAPVGPDIKPEDFIAQTITAATVQAHQRGHVIHFAALTKEAHVVICDGNDEVMENRSRRMLADRQLEQHPLAVEASILYAAASDGRRWGGTHTLTGPDAGQVAGPTEIVGPIRRSELGIHERLIRMAVGISD